jgi:hypothetical protein
VTRLRLPVLLCRYVRAWSRVATVSVDSQIAESFRERGWQAANLVRAEIVRVNGFARCWNAIGAQGDHWDLVNAIGGLVDRQLRGRPPRPGAFKRDLLLQAKNARAAATAIQAFLPAAGCGPQRWVTLHSQIERLNSAADWWERTAATLTDPGGPRGMGPFKGLILDLATMFERATGKPATLTYDQYLPGYKGRF